MLVTALVATLVPLAGPAAAVGTFDDDDGNVHESNIEAIAALGITLGCNPPANTLYCPDDYVTRQQMASFLVRTFDLPPAPAGQFTDTAGSVHAQDIDALAAAGITKGCGDGVYCPDRLMLRMEAGTFTLRADDHLRALTVLAAPPDWPPAGPPPEIPLEEREWITPPDGS